MSEQPEDRMLEVSQAAKRLRMHPETIRRYIRRGLLAALRAPGSTRGGNYLILESALRNFLATRSNRTQHPAA